MSILLIAVHIIVCIALIMIVLLQTGKGADMGAAFGGGSSQTLFGSGGASTFLSKATTVAAIIFMLTSLILAYVSTNRSGKSVVSDIKPPVTQPAAQPETTAPPATEAQSPAAESKDQPAPAEEPAKPAEAQPEKTDPAAPSTGGSAEKQ
jgi:preprotein translocase subunit SecG